jgi:protein AbiQ
MIPVPESEVEWYDVEQEKDEKYKDLVQSEIIYIRKNQEKIRKSAELIYKQKEENIENVTYLNSVLDYKGLEKKCENFMVDANKENGGNASE